MTAYVPGTHDLAGAYDSEMDLVHKATGLTVAIRDSERFFTVMQDGQRVAGTITRPRVIGGTRQWSVALPDGTSLGFAIGARTAFAKLIGHYRAR